MDPATAIVTGLLAALFPLAVQRAGTPPASGAPRA
jgi:hypothetical protein